MEVELTGRVLPNLGIVTGYSYIDAQYNEHTTFVPGPAPNNTPKHTFNACTGKGNLRVALPDEDTTAVAVSKTAAGFFAFAAPDKVQLGQHTGQALKVEIFAEKPLNEQLVVLVRPLHFGEA